DRRRRALNAAIVVLVAVAILDLVKGLDYEEAAVGLALASLLGFGRRACTRRTAKRPPLVAATVAVGAIAAFFVIECTTFKVEGKADSLARHVSHAAKLLATGGWVHSAQPTRAVLGLLFATGIGAIALAVHDLLKPLAAREGHSAEEHERALAIVRAF